MRLLRADFETHRDEDRTEFTAIRHEISNAVGDLKLQVVGMTAAQHTVSANQQAIMQALGISAAHHAARKKRRFKPVAMWGSWEFMFKLGGAMGGFMVLAKMAIGAAPGVLNGLGSAWQAVLHVIMAQ